MRHGMPGHQDRAISDRDIGGQGGGRIVCPIFHSIDDNETCNFFSVATDKFAAPPPIDAFEEKGFVKVLFIPALFYYTVESHYRDDPDDSTPDEDISGYRRRNWQNLVLRMQINPKDEHEIGAVLSKIVVPVLAPVGEEVPNPRQNFLEVRTTMRNKIVLRESHTTAIQPPGRTNDRLFGLRRKRLMVVRQNSPLRGDGGRLPNRNGG